VVAVLLSAGVQVPVMPSLEVRGNAASVAPEQIGATAANVGRMFGLTTIVSVVVVAHCPVVGVKVYVVVAVLFSAGDQVPVMPLVEVVGNAVSVAPEQIAGMAVKVGVIWLVITISIVVAMAHWPADGVKV